MDQSHGSIESLSVEDLKIYKLLKHERGQLRGSLTRFDSFLQGNPEPDLIALRVERLKGALSAFEKVQRTIDVMSGIEDSDGTAVADFEERYDALLVRAMRLMRPASAASSDRAITATASTHMAADTEVSGLSGPPSSRLPAISLPTFSGSYVEWETFRDMYTSLVHHHPSLSNVQRFHYLKSSLRGEALASLDNFAITDANYIDAWQRLQDKYGNRRVLLNNHWRAFSALAPVGKESAAALQSLFGGIARMRHALDTLGRASTAWEDWLVYFTVDRLDPATRRDWERSLGKCAEPPSFDTLQTFVEGRIQALESFPPPTTRPPAAVKVAPAQQFRPARALHAGTTSSGAGCPHCKGNHYLGYCPKLQALGIPQRRALVARLQLCFNCLRPGHARNACPSTRTCSLCQEQHHSLLHLGATETLPRQTGHPPSPSGGPTDRPPPPSSRSAAPGSSSADAEALCHHASPAAASGVLLATALVELRSPAGRTTMARALLDPGAERSFISEAIVQALRLPRRRANLSLVGVGGSTLGTAKHLVDVELSSLQGSAFSVGLQACVLPKVTAALPSTSLGHLEWEHLQGLSPLADPDFRRTGRIDVILGADVYGSLILPDVRQGPSGSPTAQLTVLGWIVFGPTNGTAATKHHPRGAEVNTCHALVASDLPALLQRFWEVEEVPAGPTLSPDDEACEQFYATTHRRDHRGRYVVRLPLTQLPLPVWSDSLTIAVHCLHRLEKRCLIKPTYGTKYSAFMAEYLSLNHMELVDDQHSTSAITPYYLPHHGVFKGSDDSGKLRVVFNASQRTRAGTSLNDHLLVGPPLQRDLTAVILSWRKHAIAVTADIEKMYRQILVDDRDAELQRIVWRNEPSQPIRQFRLKTVTYGTACAPYLAIRTLMQLATDEGGRFPQAAEALRHQSYVDDILTGADDIQSAKRLQEDLIGLLRAGGFELRKWASNRAELLNDLPTDWCQPSSSRSFDEERIKALGLEWSPGLDSFHFRVMLRSEPAVPTKRSVLSAIAKLFDPVGWIAPAIVTGKIIMQDLWLSGVDWDTPLSGHLAATWRTFYEQLPLLENVSIPRWIGYHTTQGSFQLHGFADASTRAYAAAVYLRVHCGSTTTVTLLAAKTKVAPVKQLSVPRLELCGAALLVRLVILVRSALGIPDLPHVLWSDSQVVLAWIRAHPSRWATFVANRVSFIQSSLPDARWEHVPTKDNPADLASRGVAPAALASTTLWWVGPHWLKEDQCLWPTTSELTATDLEARAGVTALATTVQPTWGLLSRFSSVTRLWRVTAWCLRFGHNCAASPRNIAPLRGPLTSTELHTSRTVCLRTVQATAFGDEIAALSNEKEVSRRSPLRKLRPFIDQRGVLRVGGRLQRARLDFDGKHPAILPRRSPLSSLLIADAHRRVLHGGTLSTLNHLMAQYWILGARDLVRAHIHQCIRCVRQRGAVVSPLMGDLPASRVTPTRPFLRSGVDYAGPIQLRASKGRGHRSTKGYIALFVCLWSKAIHLEVVSDCSTAAFLAAFQRFVSRRGLCRELLSDNGTTFHGADAELRRMFAEASTFRQDVAELIVNDGTTWTFIPPSAPHFGGLWEAGVRSTKHHLRRVIGDSTLTFEELSTVLTQVEACLNSRPLTPLSSDPTDVAALTPGHFLIGEPLLAIPEPTTLETPLTRLSRWQLLANMRDHFWHRWSTEYLHQLQQRTKWSNLEEPLQLGRLVLLKDERLPPTKWLLGRVIATHPGSDGVVRVATVKTSTSVLKRPVTKLCLLPEQPSVPAELV